MSYQEALGRISDIQRQAAGPAATAQPAAAETTVAAAPSAGTSFAAQLSSAQGTTDGIPVAAYKSAQPVQNGKLVESLYAPREQAAKAIAARFGLHVTSSYRSPAHNAEVGGVPNSLHTRGLAFDLVGSDSQMQKAKAWAESHKEMFQEVLVHDVGSGSHLHLGFRSS